MMSDEFILSTLERLANITAQHTESIQELSKIISAQQKQIKYLKDRLNEI